MRTRSAALSFVVLTMLALAGLTSTAAPVHAVARQAQPAPQPTPQGYYRMPAVRGDVTVFCAEGDLWVLRAGEDTARRLTTHLGEESHPAISPDGATVAFSAQYDGPTEVYTMPLTGGAPQRRTWEGRTARVCGWTADGRILYASRAHSGLPNWQLLTLDPATGEKTILPLAQAADGVIDPDSGAVFFTRLPFNGSHTKRYKGGTVEQIWRWSGVEGEEAVNLTADYAGTSKDPMLWNGRIYFASDRDGVMNLWSMKPDGTDPRQHTRHEGFDIFSPDLTNGRITYQVGADLWRYDIAADGVTRLTIALGSDFDQTREKWVGDPLSWVTSSHLSPDGDRVVMTARGQIYVAPAKQGRLIEVTRDRTVRHRDARFLPDGATLLTLSDESGEVEFWTHPANGMGEKQQISSDGVVLRWEGIPSPDGRWIAHHDKNLRLFLHNVETRENTEIDRLEWDDAFSNLTWSPDSTWLAYVRPARNSHPQIIVRNVEDGTRLALTTDRQISHSPAWTPDGQWLYFLSERHLQSSVPSPWGFRAPKPHFERTTKIYALALVKGLKFPFDPDTELDAAKKDEPKKSAPPTTNPPATEPTPSEPPAAPDAPAGAEAPTTPPGDKPAKSEKPDAARPVIIDADGLADRLYEVPVPNGDYSNLFATDKRLLFVTREGSGRGSTRHLVALDFNNKKIETKTIASDISFGEYSMDRRKALVRKGDAMHIIDIGGGPADMNDSRVNLSGWGFTVDPRDEWRQMFTEAWRLERDYFYDRGMHGVDWTAMLEKYRPLVDRVRTRAELSDVIAQMVAELSALHTFVRGGDQRSAPRGAEPAALGARLVRDPAAGGYVIQHIHQTDPEYPGERSPLARPGLDIAPGDVIIRLNGRAVLEARDLGELLMNQAGKQVLLHLRDGETEEERQVIVTPISPGAEDGLRYTEWEYERRLIVERDGEGDMGYVHLRAMGSGDIAQWTRDFYPVFDRKGLVIDVRHNGGGNIDSWILSELLRKAWFYWQGRAGEPYWNMQYAFRGHIVILCNERTASDGEAITEGIRRLGLGTIIGTRTWGGEIWLTSSNVLVDRGIATAAEFGVYGPEGEWLIEGHGVDPDIVVDTPPHATFRGEDAQLKAAIEFLKRKIAEQPVEVPPAPPHPDLSFPPRRGGG
ncbi:MAG: PD40 domain-containing protein [Phycisphaerales bacterium]|nr:PD40 domain-containing protein [Phycisphaerales bacterium]